MSQTRSATAVNRRSFIELGGREGAAVIIWLAMRGALSDRTMKRHQNYYRRMWGLGFSNNKGMLATGRKPGFAIQAEPGDATLSRVARTGMNDTSVCHN